MADSLARRTIRTIVDDDSYDIVIEIIGDTIRAEWTRRVHPPPSPVGCPVCGAGGAIDALDGERLCRSCGTRWNANGSSSD